ncbi:MAG: DUF2922 domain-containing protein [Clostridium sp.]|uniref:DUF2922 domain-containing protein n=1 Tax=Clostridium sp. TaxID=1506 RepID=UPI003D6D4726
MRFLTSIEGKYFNLTVDDIREDENGVPTVTEEEVNALMDLVIINNIFASANGSLTDKKDAQIGVQIEFISLTVFFKSQLP